jgi:hypothetical protein
MLQRFDWCLQEDGKSIGHLVRNSAHHGDTVACTPPPPGLLTIRQLKATHIGTFVIITAHVTEIRSDQLNPALIWVELEDHVRYSKAGRCRQIAMMARTEESDLFPCYSELLFVVEVQGASPEFMPQSEIPKTAAKLKMCLRFHAIHDPADPDESDALPAPFEEDDDDSEEEKPEAEEEQE